MAVEPTHRPDKEKTSEPHAVIDEGQDEALGTLLGKGETLAGCTFTGGSVDGGTIRATYGCPAGEVAYQLVHHGAAGRSATQTKFFAITLQSGTPPEGFATALTSRIQAHESEIKWTWIGEQPRRIAPWMIVVGVGVLLALAAFAWRLRSSKNVRNGGRSSATPPSGRGA
jgi:hypothetical protein